MRRRVKDFLATPGNEQYEEYLPHYSQQELQPANNTNKKVSKRRRRNKDNQNNSYMRKSKYIYSKLSANKFGPNPYDYSRYTQYKINPTKQIQRQMHALMISKPAPNTVITTQPKKEIRYDKMYSAYEMYRSNKFYPIYKSTLPLLYYPIYNEYDITIPVASANSTKLTAIWLPYAFPCLPNVGVTGGTAGLPVDKFSNFYTIQPTANDYTYNSPVSNLCTIAGNQRLVAATMKIANVTAMINKAGTYTAYKLINGGAVPLVYNTAHSPSEVGTPDTIKLALHEATGDKSTVNPKMLATAQQILTINEFNTVKGLDIFQSTDEYLGNKYTPAPTGTIPQYIAGLGDFNPIGPNINYAIDFPLNATSQIYKIQTWQIFEINPTNNSFSPLATVHNNCVTDDVKERMESALPFIIKS